MAYILGCTYSTMESTVVHTDCSKSQKLSSCIIVDLGNVKPINYIEMLLMDKDARSYSYEIDVSLYGKSYTPLFNHIDSYHRSWQYLHFTLRPIRFIRLIGTKAMD